jgi:hypothetical protein
MPHCSGVGPYVTGTGSRGKVTTRWPTLRAAGLGRSPAPVRPGAQWGREAAGGPRFAVDAETQCSRAASETVAAI